MQILLQIIKTQTFTSLLNVLGYTLGTMKTLKTHVFRISINVQHTFLIIIMSKYAR
jgi:hypothetical protein